MKGSYESTSGTVHAPGTKPLRRAHDLPGEVVLPARASAEQRERVATAALAGLIAQRAGHEQHQFDRAATTAVRYADALLDALNRSTAEAMHHARTR